MAMTRRTVQDDDMNTSAMAREAKEAPERVRSQLDRDSQRLSDIADTLRAFHPRAVLTCARGSSDHAATYARYMIETRLGLLTSSASPSVSSVYEAAPDLAGTALLAISQSGASPDLVATVTSAR